MEINFFGSLYWTKACLDSLIERKGMIIALSSVAGIAPLIGRSGYSASKHALHGLLETLRTEVPEIKVMMACPSFVNTGINKNTLGKDGNQANQHRLHVGKKITPEKAAEIIFQGASSEKKLLMVGGTGRLAYWVHKFFPSLYCWKMVKNLRGELE